MAELTPKSPSTEAQQEPEASEVASATKPSETVQEPQHASQPADSGQDTANQGAAKGMLLWAILALQLLTLILVLLIAFVF
ncbi:MAG: hypothetical protein CSA64_01510 [Arachnia propionica]|nr:MAG: hypothetical protein CSA64_01510 [Arachnia propionica]